ncbi:MAG TPA: hypothetical protein VFC82_11785 [Actinomycetaceae bacterium]|nr:hypothetical protein [Actinomycetaceae bacterium]
MTTVTVRWFAAAAEAAGAAQTVAHAPDGASAASVLASLTEGNERLGRIVASSSLLADGSALTDRDERLTATTLDVLPAFAGG